MLTPQVTYYRVTRHAQDLIIDFLKYYFDSRPAEVFQAWAGGGVHPSLSGHNGTACGISDSCYRLSTIKNAIASLLGALDDKIDLNRRMNETLEAMARAIFKDWFVDFGPTRAKMEGRASYLAPEIWTLFPDRLDDEGKPEGWQTDRWRAHAADFEWSKSNVRRIRWRANSQRQADLYPDHGATGVMDHVNELRYLMRIYVLIGRRCDVRS